MIPTPRPVTGALPVRRAPGCGEGRGSHAGCLGRGMDDVDEPLVSGVQEPELDGIDAGADAASFINDSSAKFCWRCPGVRMISPRNPAVGESAPRFGIPYTSSRRL